MSRSLLTGFLLIGFFMGLTGFLLHFFRVPFGFSLAQLWLLSETEVGNIDAFYFILHKYTKNFFVIGSVLFGFGFLTVILSYCKLTESNYEEME